MLAGCEVQALPLWRTNSGSLALLLLMRYSARGACFFLSRVDASTSRLSFGVGAINTCNNGSTQIERTFNRTFSTGSFFWTRIDHF